jgi:multidrug efflux pump subunit AcrA (membrane-fusion protein)
LVLAIVLLVGAIVFGAWAYTSRQDYKDNSDAKAAVAVEAAKKQLSAEKDKQFAEQAKQPLKTYNGPAAYGSLSIMYPKTWSAYVDTSGNSGSSEAAVDAYFNPDVVPGIKDKAASFALRAQVLNQQYSQVLDSFDDQARNGDIQVGAYSLPKMPSVVGVKVTGQITKDKNVTMIVLPLRSQTIEIWTEGDQYLNDFNTNILPNVTFIP